VNHILAWRGAAGGHYPPPCRDEAGDGPIKSFTLRGIKDRPPYLHDGRLLTLEDSVEFFNLVLTLKLTKEEKQEVVAFLRQL
jgi:cytochrome c peroxidase